MLLRRGTRGVAAVGRSWLGCASRQHAGACCTVHGETLTPGNRSFTIAADVRTESDKGEIAVNTGAYTRNLEQLEQLLALPETITSIEELIAFREKVDSSRVFELLIDFLPQLAPATAARVFAASMKVCLVEREYLQELNKEQALEYIHLRLEQFISYLLRVVESKGVHGSVATVYTPALTMYVQFLTATIAQQEHRVELDFTRILSQFQRTADFCEKNKLILAKEYDQLLNTQYQLVSSPLTPGFCTSLVNRMYIDTFRILDFSGVTVSDTVLSSLINNSLTALAPVFSFVSEKRRMFDNTVLNSDSVYGTSQLTHLDLVPGSVEHVKHQREINPALYMHSHFSSCYASIDKELQDKNVIQRGADWLPLEHWDEWLVYQQGRVLYTHVMNVYTRVHSLKDLKKEDTLYAHTQLSMTELASVLLKHRGGAYFTDNDTYLGGNGPHATFLSYLTQQWTQIFTTATIKEGMIQYLLDLEGKKHPYLSAWNGKEGRQVLADDVPRKIAEQVKESLVVDAHQSLCHVSLRGARVPTVIEYEKQSNGFLSSYFQQSLGDITVGLSNWGMLQRTVLTTQSTVGLQEVADVLEQPVVPTNIFKLYKLAIEEDSATIRSPAELRAAQWRSQTRDELTAREGAYPQFVVDVGPEPSFTTEDDHDVIFARTYSSQYWQGVGTEARWSHMSTSSDITNYLSLRKDNQKNLTNLDAQVFTVHTQADEGNLELAVHIIHSLSQILQHDNMSSTFSLQLSRLMLPMLEYISPFFTKAHFKTNSVHKNVVNNLLSRYDADYRADLEDLFQDDKDYFPQKSGQSSKEMLQFQLTSSAMHVHSSLVEFGSMLQAQFQQIEKDFRTCYAAPINIVGVIPGVTTTNGQKNWALHMLDAEENHIGSTRALLRVVETMGDSIDTCFVTAKELVVAVYNLQLGIPVTRPTLTSLVHQLEDSKTGIHFYRYSEHEPDQLELQHRMYPVDVFHSINSVHSLQEENCKLMGDQQISMNNYSRHSAHAYRLQQMRESIFLFHITLQCQEQCVEMDTKSKSPLTTLLSCYQSITSKMHQQVYFLNGQSMQMKEEALRAEKELICLPYNPFDAIKAVDDQVKYVFDKYSCNLHEQEWDSDEVEHVIHAMKELEVIRLASLQKTRTPIGEIDKLQLCFTKMQYSVLKTQWEMATLCANMHYFMNREAIRLGTTVQSVFPFVEKITTKTLPVFPLTYNHEQVLPLLEFDSVGQDLVKSLLDVVTPAAAAHIEIWAGLMGKVTIPAKIPIPQAYNPDFPYIVKFNPISQLQSRQDLPSTQLLHSILGTAEPETILQWIDTQLSNTILCYELLDVLPNIDQLYEKKDKHTYIPTDIASLRARKKQHIMFPSAALATVKLLQKEYMAGEALLQTIIWNAYSTPCNTESNTAQTQQYTTAAQRIRDGLQLHYEHIQIQPHSIYQTNGFGSGNHQMHSLNQIILNYANLLRNSGDISRAQAVLSHIILPK